MEIKFRDLVAFRTEDNKFPAANLLRGGKWLSDRKSRESVNDVILHLGEARLISHIDVGNWGSSFITIEVSRVGLQRYQMLLPSTEIMSGRDAQAKKNWTSVHMFSKEHFVEDILEQKWNLVKITCSQPFLQNEQFGLSFLKIFSITEDELPGHPEPESPPQGSVFQKMRECTLAKMSPLVQNRSQQLVLAAIEKQRTCLERSSCSKDASSSKDSENSPVKSDRTLHKINGRANTSHGSMQKSLYNNNSNHNNNSRKNTPNCAAVLQTNTLTTCKLSSIKAGSDRNVDSHLAQAAHSSPSAAYSQKHTLPDDAVKNTSQSLRKRQRTSLLSPSDSENMRSPAPKGASRSKLSSSGKQLKLLQRQVKSPHGDHRKDQGIVLVTDSDSDNPSSVMPLATVSPNRELRNFYSDLEPVVLTLDEACDEIHNIKEVVTLSSSEHSPSDFLLLHSDPVPGPSRIACPLCSDYFDAFLIEQHAASCGLTSGTSDSICPICSRYFPPENLPRHADLCAERSRL